MISSCCAVMTPAPAGKRSVSMCDLEHNLYSGTLKKDKIDLVIYTAPEAKAPEAPFTLRSVLLCTASSIRRR